MMTQQEASDTVDHILNRVEITGNTEIVSRVLLSKSKVPGMILANMIGNIGQFGGWQELEMDSFREFLITVLPGWVLAEEMEKAFKESLEKERGDQ